MMKKIQVVSFENREVVEEIDVSGKSESQIDRIEMGLLINMDMDNYFTRIVGEGDGK